MWVVVSGVVFLLYPLSLISNYYDVLTTPLNFIMLLVGLICCFKLLLLRQKGAGYWFWLAFLFINAFYYRFYQSYDPTAFGQMGGVILINVTFYTFMFLGLKGHIGDEFMRRLFFVVLIVAAFIHFDALATKRFSRNESEVVVNTSYVFAYLVPYVFFVRSHVKSFLILSFIVFMLVTGAKRGAMLIGSVGVIIWFIYAFFHLRGDKRQFLNRSLFASMLVLMFFVLLTFLFSKYSFIAQRLLNLGEGEGGSGRAEMFDNILSGWLNDGDLFNILFGYGFSASRSFTGNGLYAHNDWLETLINFGLLGLAVYGFFWISCIKIATNKSLYLRVYKFQMVSSISLCLLATLFSMVYASASAGLAIGLLGYLTGRTVFNYRNDVAELKSAR